MADSFCWTGLCLISFCMFMTIAGSTLIYTAFYKKSSLRNNSNALFLSLVTANLLTALTVFPVEILNLWHHPNWPLGGVACRLWNTLFVTFASLSVLNLCVISMERLWALKNPFQYDPTVLSKRFLLLFALIWFYSSICGVYSYFIWHVNTPTCKQLSSPLAYAIPLLLINILVPYAACIVAYAKIFQISHSHVRNIITVEENVHNKWTNGKRKNVMAKLLARKSTLTIGLLVGSFTICCFPFFIFHIIDGAFDEKLPGRYISSNIMKWFVFVGSSSNWALYGFLNRDFRQAMLRILRKLKGRSNSVTTVHSFM